MFRDFEPNDIFVKKGRRFWQRGSYMYGVACLVYQVQNNFTGLHHFQFSIMQVETPAAMFASPLWVMGLLFFGAQSIQIAISYVINQKF